MNGQSVDAVAEPPPPDDPILWDFNELFHRLRTLELRHLPIDGGTILSAGCSGAWYFDWLEECAGPFERHIGVELYSPEPADLPANVTWIPQSASSMPGVADGSVDLVFSGQNLEHLWIDDVVGFLLESNRVLRNGGTLVVDSPNRHATHALGWIHPEHTIEFSADEASELFRLAGFAERERRGLWNCRDNSGDGWIELYSHSGDARELLDRSAARFSVDDSFAWWLEAQKVSEPVGESELRERVGELFVKHWNPRVNRAAGCGGVLDDDGQWVLPAGAEGVVYRTHGFPLFPGEFDVSCHPAAALTVRLFRNDGSELASGRGGASGVLETTEFGVMAELVADEPLRDSVTAVGVAVDQRGRAAAAPSR